MIARRSTVTVLAVLGTFIFLLGGEGAVASESVVTAGQVSNLTATSVTFNGTVDPNGLDAHTIQFEYGSTPAYGSIAAATPTDAGSGDADVAVTANETGLSPNTLYYFRLTATNSNDTDRSLAGIFKTPVPPPAVNDQQAFASSVTQFTATLNGTVNPEGVPTAYHFAYGQTAAYGSIAPVPDIFPQTNNAENPVTQEITGLTAGTTYHFALVAGSPGGVTVGHDQTFTTDTIPAPTVSTGTASGVTVGTATLSGSIDPQGWNTSYHFQYGTTTAYGFNWPTIDINLGALTGAQDITIYIQNLLPGTLYHYRLVATSGGGTTYGGDQTFLTPEYAASVIQQTPEIGPIGITPPKQTTARGLTNAQKLANALKACKRKPKQQRATCRRQARKRYAPVR